MRKRSNAQWCMQRRVLIKEFNARPCLFRCLTQYKNHLLRKLAETFRACTVHLILRIIKFIFIKYIFKIIEFLSYY